MNSRPRSRTNFKMAQPTGSESSQSDLVSCHYCRSESGLISSRHQPPRMIWQCILILSLPRSQRCQRLLLYCSLLITALVLSHFDFGNMSLASLPVHQLDWLQTVGNTAHTFYALLSIKRGFLSTDLRRNAHIPSGQQLQLAAIFWIDVCTTHMTTFAVACSRLWNCLMTSLTARRYRNRLKTCSLSAFLYGLELLVNLHYTLMTWQFFN